MHELPRRRVDEERGAYAPAMARFEKIPADEAAGDGPIRLLRVLGSKTD
jgi:hypothetical protein